MDATDFSQLITTKGQELFRAMPWRSDTRPYYILVSELMLQQTQVDRVIPKFELFISAFPSEHSLAKASLADVLRVWQGLGYNRRAKYLHQAAAMIVSDFGGSMPDSQADLQQLPGVGRNTAGAIGTYAFNQPVLFIETNIRTVYFHHFFDRLETVSDADIQPLLEQTLDKTNPRAFYWALMDYGSWLKRSGVKNVGQSRHYKKQSPLSGSVRQIRGAILSSLATKAMTTVELERTLPLDERFDPALSSLLKEGLVAYSGGRLCLAESSA